MITKGRHRAVMNSLNFTNISRTNNQAKSKNSPEKNKKDEEHLPI